MKNCKTCVNNPWLPDGRLGQMPEVCLKCRYVATEEPSNWTPKPKTNAEHIQTMSREDLATGILATHLGYAPWCDQHCPNEGGGNCPQCIEKWLKQVAQEGK